jgi:hypothetical protein
LKRFFFHRSIKYSTCELGANFFYKDLNFQDIQAHYKKTNKMSKISIKNSDFIDEENRIVIFRGINISAKIPFTDPTLKKNNKATFVGSPFPLEEADLHLSRLKYLGFNLLRWVVPWEALCPDEPKKYDLLYLEYLDNLVAIAEKYDFFILIDFHQDVWSRYTGGSGAPLWTLEKIGLKVCNFEKCLAAISHKKKERYPLGHLFWATNADRYAAKTMYTLFFGGNTFAPEFKIDGENVQDYLQQNYILAISKCVKKLVRHDHVIGYDIMNEPHLGYIGCKDLHKFHGLFRLGPSPLPLDGFALSEGVSRKVDFFEKKLFNLKSTRKDIYDPNQESVWENKECIWRKLGVWGYDKNKEPVLLRKNYFSSERANADFYVPFIQKVCTAISDIDKEKICFIEHATNHDIPKIPNVSYKLGFSGHWYDAFVISMRQVWNFISVDMSSHKVKLNLPHFIHKDLSMQISKLTKKVFKSLGKIPFILSEFGIPFDLYKNKAYKSGNFIKQKEGLERSFKAVESSLVSSIIWNYTAFNSNQEGDLWNNEDFSIFSMDQHYKLEDPYSGIRAKEAIVRPYPIKIPGTLIKYSFDNMEGFFSCSFNHFKENKAPLEIFLPTIHFGEGFEIGITCGHYEVNYLDQRILFYPDSTFSTHHKINIYKKRCNKKKFGEGLTFFT